MKDGPVDTGVWRHDTRAEVPTYNDEKQAYTDNERNVRIEDNKLVLEAHREREPYQYPDDSIEYDFTSGRIDTLIDGGFCFEFGRIEARIKSAHGQGAWPAFWLLSANNKFTKHLDSTGVDWSQWYKKDGEIDIFETDFRRPGQVEGTLHAYDKVTEGVTDVPDADQAFHTYGIDIAPDKLVWTIDGKPFKTLERPKGGKHDTDKWPIGHGNKFYVILNLAMGGTGGGEINPDYDKWRMEVERVSFYEYTGE
jgi:beta-glucanase (GH16 family)